MHTHNFCGALTADAILDCESVVLHSLKNILHANQALEAISECPLHRCRQRVFGMDILRACHKAVPKDFEHAMLLL